VGESIVIDDAVIAVERKLVQSMVGKGIKTMRTICVIKIMNSCVSSMIAMFVAVVPVARFEVE